MTTDKPTPTSSLEEARQSLVRCEACKGRGGFSDTSMGRGGFAGQMLTGCRACSGSGIDTRELEAFIAAAARADVIREVEARINAASMEANHHEEFYRGVERAKRAALRALSQGGEGKSDG